MKYPPTYVRRNLKAIAILALGSAAAFALADLSFGDPCSTGTCANVVAHQPVAHQAQVVHQQAYASPVVSQHVYYFVGAPVRAEALVEEAKLADPDYQEFLRFKQFQQQLREHGHHDGETPPPEPAPPRFSQTASVVKTSCISCHSGQGAKGGLDLTRPIDEGTKWRMFMRAADGSMPPNKSLPDEQLRELLIELSET